MVNHRTRSRQLRLCPYCSRSFTKDEHLARHVRTHTKEKPFVCTVCSKAFSRNDSLLRHRRSHQSASAPPVTPDTTSIADDALDERMPDTNGGGSNSLALPADNSSQHDVWDFNNPPSIPAWLANDDFDLDAFNSEILLSTTNWLVPPNYPEPVNNEDLNYPDPPLLDTHPTSTEDLVHKEWFTLLAPSQTGHVTPDTGPEQTQVDEAYRERLAVKLQPHISTPPLPSTDFLNICIQMYFTKFHPIFPIVHAPTFRPSSTSSLLLLSICSIGSLFVGSAHAASQGSKIFETLNKAILSSWERYMSRGGKGAVAMIQAALIGQTFGLLSGRPKDLLTIQSFHGTVLAWARKSEMFKTHAASDFCTSADIVESPEQSWKTWITAEEYNRIATGIYIHDAEISELFQTDPFLRHSPSKFPPRISDDYLWAAKTADAWGELMLEQLRQIEENNPSPSSAFDLAELNLRRCMELAGLGASIIDEKTAGIDISPPKSTESLLIKWYDLYLKPHVGKQPDILCLQMQWHATFHSMYANLNRLELVIGKEGYAEAQKQLSYARVWACSEDGQRCALHAAMILRQLEHMSLGAGIPIHVPRIVFRAAIVWFCHTKFGSDDLGLPRPVTEFPEFGNMGLSCQRLLFEANGFKAHWPKTPESSTFCGLVDVLQRIGHWGISRKLASILTLLLPEVAEGEGYGGG